MADGNQERLAQTGLGWLGIVRLGLVQACIGGVVVLATSTLNRVMTVELGMLAIIPALLVAWHYVVQLSRAKWGHSSDRGAQRTPWIVGGMGVLGLGTVLAVDGALVAQANPVVGGAILVLGFSMIGMGVGACGTSLLALMAAEVAPKRRAAAAAITWTMMIAGFVISTAVTSMLLDPYSPQRLALVVTGVAVVALVLTWLATWRLETGRRTVAREVQVPFRTALADVWADPVAKAFTGFIFVAMVAYAMQDLILEPFAGLRFGYTVAESTRLASMQHGGALLGMVGMGVLGTLTGGHKAAALRNWTVIGCTASALALAGLGVGAAVGEDWPLKANVFALGLANGVFTVAAIGMMMERAGSGGPGREGIRMGLWGAAQAMAFALGGFLGAAGVDMGRVAGMAVEGAFAISFSVEAVVFLAAGYLAWRLPASGSPAARVAAYPNEFAAELRSSSQPG